AMSRTLRHNLDAFLSVAPRAGAAPADAYRFVLDWKGAVFVRQHRFLQDRQRPELAAGFAEWQQTCRDLANRALAVPPAKEQEAWHQKLAELTQKKEQLERDLARDSAPFRQQQAQRQRTPAEVQQALPADSVLLDFLQYTHSTPPPGGKGKLQREQHLAVFVVQVGRPIRYVDLG